MEDSFLSWQNSAINLIKQYGDMSKSWAAKDDARYDAYDKQRNKLIEDAGSYRRYFANDDIGDHINNIADFLQKNTGYELNRYFSNWDTEDDYKKALRDTELRNKYKGMSYSELKSVMGGMDRNSSEYAWLEQYAPTTRTDKEYESDIANNSNNLTQLRRIYNKMNMELTGMLRGGRTSQQDIDTARQEMDGVKARIGELQMQIENDSRGQYFAQNAEKYAGLFRNDDYSKLSKIAVDDKGKAPEDGMRGNDKYAFMTDEERGNYNYLYNTDGKRRQMSIWTICPMSLTVAACRSSRKTQATLQARMHLPQESRLLPLCPPACLV